MQSSTLISRSLEEIQNRLQDTTTEGNSSDDSDGDTPPPPPPSPVVMKTCSGMNGCMGSFPAKQPGADFRYGMLCSSCFKKGSGKAVI